MIGFVIGDALVERQARRKHAPAPGHTEVAEGAPAPHLHGVKGGINGGLDIGQRHNGGRAGHVGPADVVAGPGLLDHRRPLVVPPRRVDVLGPCIAAAGRRIQDVVGIGAGHDAALPLLIVRRIVRNAGGAIEKRRGLVSGIDGRRVGHDRQLERVVNRLVAEQDIDKLMSGCPQVFEFLAPHRAGVVEDQCDFHVVLLAHDLGGGADGQRIEPGQLHDRCRHLDLGRQLHGIADDLERWRRGEGGDIFRIVGGDEVVEHDIGVLAAAQGGADGQRRRVERVGELVLGINRAADIDGDADRQKNRHRGHRHIDDDGTALVAPDPEPAPDRARQAREPLVA